MDATDIFIKSPKGEQEIVTKVNKLPIKHRSVLIMIDGKMTEHALLARLSGMFDGKAIVTDLESHGFIERKAAQTIDPAAPRMHEVHPAGPKTSFLEGLVNKVKDMSEEYEAKAK